jgi:hypothetical protein
LTKSPVEGLVRRRHLPGATNAFESTKTEDFSDRGGYEPGFIPYFVVALRRLASDHPPLGGPLGMLV